MNPAIVDLSFRCAVRDKPFFCRFRVNQFLPNRYFFDRVVTPSEAVGVRSAADANWIYVAASALPLGVKCPHCSAKLFVCCDRCQSFVCEGRVTGNFFGCTDACGASGPITPAQITPSGHEVTPADTTGRQFTFFHVQPPGGQTPPSTTHQP